MKTRGRVAAGLATTLIFGLPVAALAVCVAIVSDGMKVEGVVASPSFGGAIGCRGDNGWGSIAGWPFEQIQPAAGSAADVPTIFLAGHKSPIDTVYVGVHVPYDQDLRRADRLTIYFDVNNIDQLDAGDFALVYEVGPDTPIDAGEDCDRPPGYEAIFWYDPAKPAKPVDERWGTATTPIAKITSRFAFDYDDADPEASLWELEIGIPKDLFGLLPTGFKVGAKLYIQDPANNAYETWVWPSGLTAEGNPDYNLPVDGGVTASSLEFVDFTDCADVVIEAISATNPAGQPDKFRRPQPGDWVNGVLPANKRNNFTASVKFFNPSDPFDQTLMVNTGKVDFTIRPYGGGQFLNEQLMHTEQVPFTALGQSYPISFQWPETQQQYNPIQNDMQVSEHSCLRVEAKDFPLNLNPAGDKKYRNLTYTALSKLVDTFLVSTRTPDLREGTQTLQFLMRAKWRNVPRSARGWGVRIASTDSSVPLKDMGNGYYTFSMRPQQDRHFQVEVAGGAMPIKALTFSLDPRVGGTATLVGDGLPAMAIPVKEGQQITTLAQGRIRVLPDSAFNDANGRIEREVANRRYLLGGNAVAPARHIGALIGSFNAFRTSFVIGADRSFVVPKGAKELLVAVNDVVGQYKDNRDGQFTLYVFITEPHRLPTQYFDPGNAAIGQPAIGEPAANLPQLHIDVFQVLQVQAPQVELPPSGGVTTPGAPTGRSGSMSVRPFSYVTYAVYESHPTIPGGGGGGCKPRGALGFAQFSGLSALGIVLLRRRKRRDGSRS